MTRFLTRFWPWSEIERLRGEVIASDADITIYAEEVGRLMKAWQDEKRTSKHLRSEIARLKARAKP